MSDVLSLLRQARCAGLRLSIVDDDRLQVDGVKPELRPLALAIGENKDGVLRALRLEEHRLAEDTEAVAAVLYQRLLRRECGTGRPIPVPPLVSPSARGELWSWYWMAVELNRRERPWPYPEPPAQARILTTRGLFEGKVFEIDQILAVALAAVKEYAR